MTLKKTGEPPNAPTANAHEIFMKRALELACCGAGNVSPNPLVGAVIVHENRIIGEGWHKHYGGPHAEVNAIAAVADKSILAESTLYVNLEPCSHTGKTPPCADLIVRHNLQRVVIANEDPNPLVAGSGIGKLRDAGIEVVTDILPAEGHLLNKRFFTYMKKKRPHIILKWAETSDGFVARENFDSKWISDDYSRQLVHKWRTEEDSVLVGTGTVLHDNPSLTARDWTGRNPVRVVIDRHLKLGAAGQHLFDHQQKTICYNLVKDVADENLIYVRLPEDRFLQSVMDDLYHRKIQSVIVEGGAQVLSAFIQSGLWDEARIFVSPQRFLAGIAAPPIRGQVKEQKKLGADWLKIIEPSGYRL